ncbi:MAG: tRNA guanosine(34) transglycosylase Tgt [Patescibacteria group bacterium]|nr:tRNA guanosine(34) transglycosylase Tgt [Patescibacteria group bacterium]MDE2437896.1 tRNA guanosine(34) transglycosylase Tgt [Patescibacteria group bacterium]
MMEFSVVKRSKKTKARVGILMTSHGEIETPAFVPVATQATIKALTIEETARTESQLLIANTFHLHLKPGEALVKRMGGLHAFMNWKRPLMTDSGGFQVFSLGFGRDMQVGKVLKFFPGSHTEFLHPSAQPQSVKITSDGVFFRSPLDGKELFLGPKESMKIQATLGADMIFAFDECTSPLATHAYIKESLARTHAWETQCLALKKRDQALFGIVQGSRFKDLRVESAAFIGGLPFDGFGIGGDLGASKKTMQDILHWTMPHLPEGKPRHLLGIGYLEDMEMVVKSGIDTFDCIVPTHYARHGVAFTHAGKLSIAKPVFARDKKPLDPTCACEVCQHHSRSYISHLYRAKEIAASEYLTFHNLFYFNTFVAAIRKKIKTGVL